MTNVISDERAICFCYSCFVIVSSFVTSCFVILQSTSMSKRARLRELIAKARS